MNLDCSNIQTIKDISNQVENLNKSKDKKSDKQWVSCGQDNDYSELYNKYEKHFEEFDEKIIANLMCVCCKKLKSNGKEKVTWLEFYECMKQNNTSPLLPFSEYAKSSILKDKLNELIEKHKKEQAANDL